MKIELHLHPKNLKLWLVTILAIIPVLFTAGTKAKEWIINTTPLQSQQEFFTEHMTRTHLYTEDSRAEEVIKIDGIKISMWVFSDGCIVVRRIEKNGIVSVIDVLPDPDKIQKIKEGLININTFSLIKDCLADSNEHCFDLGWHNEDNYWDDAYRKSKKKGESCVTRIYWTDRCKLEYEVDKDGLAYGWWWAVYRHTDEGHAQRGSHAERGGHSETEHR